MKHLPLLCRLGLHKFRPPLVDLTTLLRYDRDGRASGAYPTCQRCGFVERR